MRFSVLKKIFSKSRRQTNLEYYSDILFDVVITFTVATIIISILHAIYNMYKLNINQTIIASVRHAESTDEREKTGNTSTKLLEHDYRKFIKNNNNY